MSDRKCLECYEQLKGRADQKFCNDQCRSAYNNRQLVDSNKVIRAINRILKKNYSILSTLNPDGKATVHLSDLQKIVAVISSQVRAGKIIETITFFLQIAQEYGGFPLRIERG